MTMGSVWLDWADHGRHRQNGAGNARSRDKHPRQRATENRNVRDAVFPTLSAIDRVILWFPVGRVTFVADRLFAPTTACLSSRSVMLSPSHP